MSGGRRFERRNSYNIALCVHEHNKIKVELYLKNKYYANISDMIYYYNGKNESVLVSDLEHQTITL